MPDIKIGWEAAIAAPAVPRVATIPERIDSLRGDMETVKELLAELCGQLHPVLSPENPPQSVAGALPVSAPLSEPIEALRADLRGAQETLRHLINRLEL